MNPIIHKKISILQLKIEKLELTEEPMKTMWANPEIEFTKKEINKLKGNYDCLQ